MADYDVIIIGAGCGGLSAGAILAKQGRKVLILEQSSRVGGCCSTFEKDGFHFDVGASIVEIIDPIKLFFNLCGTSLEKELDLIPIDPIFSFVKSDGQRINYPLSIESTAEVISSFSKKDGENWLRLADYFSDLMKQTVDSFLTKPANGIIDVFRMAKKNPKMIKFLPLFMKSYQDVILHYFSDETIIQTMAFQSYYCGLPPELAPGFMAFVPYSEHEGIYYPRGGMIQIPESLRRVGERHGVQIRFNTLVDRVMVRKKKAHGVILKDGTEITSKIVVSNVNAKKLYLEMIGEEHIPWLARFGLKSYELSMPFPVVYVGVDYRPPLEAHHNINIGPIELMNEFWHETYLKGLLPEKPYGLVTIPSLSDASLAPEGHHVVTLMGMAPYHLQGTDWDKEKEKYIEQLVDFHSEVTAPGLKDHITTIECATPLDFERKLLLPGGSIYGLQMDIAAQACFRPSSRSKSIEHLYLTGSSTHPGGGVPSVIASGIIAAEQIDKYE